MCFNIGYLFPFIIDPTGQLKKIIKIKYFKEKKKIIFESETTNAETFKNIKEALHFGHILVIENFDDKLLYLIQPLLEYRYDEIFKQIFSDQIKEYSTEDCESPTYKRKK